MNIKRAGFACCARPKHKVEGRVDQETDEAVDQAIDRGLDRLFGN